MEKLAALYWFTIEFGLCLEKGKRKAYGAGIISSVGELEYCMTDKPKCIPLDPFLIGDKFLNYPISSMQPTYFVAESFETAKRQIKEYCNSIKRPFNVTFNEASQTVFVDRKIRTRKEKSGGKEF